MDLHNHMHGSLNMKCRNYKTKSKKAFDNALILTETMIECLNYILSIMERIELNLGWNTTK